MEENNFDLLKLENQICFPLYAASREVVKLYRPHLDALNLTYTQYIAMMVMWEEKQCSVKELGKRLYLDSGTLTPVLKSLEQKGYVRRFRMENDERVMLTEITDKGEALKEQAKEVPPKVGCNFMLSAEQSVELYKLLYTLLGNISGKS